MQKVEGADAVYGMSADKPFDLTAIADAQLPAIKVPHFSKFIGNHIICAIKDSGFDHEWPGCDQSCHFRVVKCAAQVELKDLVFVDPEVLAMC